MLFAFPPGSAYGTKNRRRSAGVRVACIGGPGDGAGGDAMTMMDTARAMLRATGNLLAQTLGVDGKANAIRSSWGLTSADDADAIMVAGSPGLEAMR